MQMTRSCSITNLLIKHPLSFLYPPHLRIGTCAYYGTRKAVAQAELICMPYTTLLHKQTRESMNIPLEDNIVLIDEAHNLIEAVNAVHTNYLPLHAVSQGPWFDLSSFLMRRSNIIVLYNLCRLIERLVK